MLIEQRVLTPEQTAALSRYRARWTAIRRSTEAADREAAKKGVRLAYVAAGIKPPARFIWCESPIALSRRAHQASRTDGANVRFAIVERVRRKVAAAVKRRLPEVTRREVEAAVNPPDALVSSAAEAVIEATPQDETSLLQLARRSYPLSWSSALQALAGRQGFRYEAAGQHDLSWLGPFEYFRGVLGLRGETEPLAGLWQAAANLGWFQPHENTCWLAERPEVLRGDARDQLLHHANGPALRFRDGWSVWAWRGVEVPRWMIEQPERITLEIIDAETNVQVRRCMIEIMTPRRYIAQGGAVPVAEDETGILWRKTWLVFDAWAAVEVINATPEPDGTHRHFFLQVPANLRTAREAVAWTYGLQPKEYSQLVLRT